MAVVGLRCGRWRFVVPSLVERHRDDHRRMATTDEDG
jgi:hypothetical protein